MTTKTTITPTQALLRTARMAHFELANRGYIVGPPHVPHTARDLRSLSEPDKCILIPIVKNGLSFGEPGCRYAELVLSLCDSEHGEAVAFEVEGSGIDTVLPIETFDRREEKEIQKLLAMPIDSLEEAQTENPGTQELMNVLHGSDRFIDPAWKPTLREGKMKIQLQMCRLTGSPDFAPSSGICWGCRGDITEFKTAEQMTALITGCPHCCRSYCE